MNDNNDIILRCEALSRAFVEGERTLTVLEGLNLDVRRGESLAIVGASGAGKTTLLQLLGGLDTPTSGRVLLDGQDLSQVDEIRRGHLRNELLGFVYQFHHLLPEFTALENVAMPLMIRGANRRETLDRAQAILTDVGLGERLDHKPAQLSGGERQRAAVARAMVTEPALILADEPTGNLDGATGQRVFTRLLELKDASGTALVVVTHDPRIARQMDRVMRLTGGTLEPVAHDTLGT
ncbi:MAG: ATP-binding cassette domain-containing protein [Pseudomonadota bacterium]